MFESIAANPAIPIGRVAYPEDIGKVCVTVILFIYISLFIVVVLFTASMVLVKTLLVIKNDFEVILFLADRSKSEIIIGNIVTADGGCVLKSAMFPDN